MRKLLFILGTRPEVIKLAPVITAAKHHEGFDAIVCTTSQHREMQDQMMALFDIKADHDLNVMAPNQSLSEVTHKIIKGLDPILTEESPDVVITQGDTSTCFLGSLAAFYHRIPVAHVEAGLRTNNLYSPFPEEGNRRLVSKIASLHFTPTETAKHHLVSEGIHSDSIFVSGNTVTDALFYMISKIKTEENLSLETIQDLLPIIKTQRYILVTAHRRENHGDGIDSICRALLEISQNNPGVHIIFPVHLNPSIKETVQKILSKDDKIHLLTPVSYIEMVYLMQHCYFILTDSGGVQEEGPSLYKPLLIMRENSERPEGITAGCAKLVGTQKEFIVTEVQDLLDNENAYKAMQVDINPYGDGQCSVRILSTIRKELEHVLR